MNKRLLSIVCFLGIIVLTSCSNPEKEATKLLDEASEIFRSAMELEKTSFTQAYNSYEEVLTKIEEIETKYPDSEVAKGLNRGDVKIDFLTAAKLKEYVSFFPKLNAQAEEDVLSCAIAMVYVMEDYYRQDALNQILSSGSADIDHFDQALMVVRNLPPSSETSRLFGVISEKFVESDRFDRASELIDEITDPDIKMRLFIAMANKYSESGEFKKATETIKLIEDQYRRNLMFSSIAIKNAEAGQDEQSFEVIDLIDSEPARVKALADIAKVYAKVGRKKEAAEILTQVIEEGKNIKDPSERENILMFDVVSNEAAGVSHYEEILDLSGTIKDPSIKCMVLSDLAEKYFEIGQKGKALELLSKAIESANDITRDNVDFFISKEDHLSFVAFRFIDLGEHERAYKVIKSVPRENWYAGEPYATMAKYYAQKGQFGYAEKMIKMTDRSYGKVEALLGLSDEYYKANDIPEALTTLSRAFEAALKIESPFTRSLNLEEISIRYGKIGKTEEAQRVLSVALEDAKKIENDDYKETSLTSIAGNKYASDEQRYRAFEIAKTIPKEYLRDTALHDIAQEYVGFKQYDKALEVSYAIGDLNDAVSSMIKLAAQYAEDGEKEQAIETLSKAVERVDEDEIYNYKAPLLVKISGEYIKIGQKDKAFEVLDEAFADAALTKRDFSSADTLRNIAINYARIGKYEDAFKMIRFIDELKERATTLVMISNTYPTEGRSLNKEEKELLHQITADLGL
ncbi:tetratricopeptide repeat protein [Candidatus Omnitrophota bacterium]